MSVSDILNIFKKQNKKQKQNFTSVLFKYFKAWFKINYESLSQFLLVSQTNTLNFAKRAKVKPTKSAFSVFQDAVVEFLMNKNYRMSAVNLICFCFYAVNTLTCLTWKQQQHTKSNTTKHRLVRLVKTIITTTYSSPYVYYLTFFVYLHIFLLFHRHSMVTQISTRQWSTYFKCCQSDLNSGLVICRAPFQKLTENSLTYVLRNSCNDIATYKKYGNNISNLFYIR